MGMLATISDYAERIRQGKEIESQIIESWRTRLVPINFTLEAPTEQEDIQDKIDVWLINPLSRRFSVQVKYRETGDDLIFEAVKDLATWKDGRDYISKAELYFFIDRLKTGWLYKTQAIKDSVKLLREMVQKDLQENTGQTHWKAVGCDLKVTVDHANGNSKLMAFFVPTHFPVLMKFDKLI